NLAIDCSECWLTSCSFFFSLRHNRSSKNKYFIVFYPVLKPYREFQCVKHAFKRSVYKDPPTTFFPERRIQKTDVHVVFFFQKGGNGRQWLVCKNHLPAYPGIFFIQILSRSEEHTSELQSRENLVCRLLLEK